MSSKLYRFIKPSFFILFFISFIFNKNYAQKCIDVTSNVNQKLAIQAVVSQSYLNNLVIRFDESKKKYVDTVYEMKDLTEAIEVGLVDLSKDVQQATETERSLIRTASGILEYQYSLNEQAASVVDFLLSAPVKQKQIPLDLDFLDKKIFKEGFNTVPEFYSDQIDELLGYVHGDPYATKAALIASKLWDVPSLSTSWHPSGNYVVITGGGGVARPQLSIYNFDGKSLGSAINPTPPVGGEGAYLSIDWSPDRGNLGGYLVGGGSRNSVDSYDIRVFKFDMGLKEVMEVAKAQFNPGTPPPHGLCRSWISCMASLLE